MISGKKDMSQQPPHNWTKFQKIASKRFKIFMKLSDNTFACKDLTNFECKAQATGNGSYVNLQKLAWKNS
jgi:hypothetical protein